MPKSTSSSSCKIQTQTAEKESPSGCGAQAVRRAVQMEHDAKKNLRLNYKYYEYFVYSQFGPAWSLLLLRFLIGGTCIAVFIYVSVLTNTSSSSSSSSTTTTTASSTTMKSHFFLCYLTVWSYLMVTLYFTCALVNTISVWLCSCRKSADGQEDGNSAGCCSIAAGGAFSLTDCGYRTADRLAAARKGAGLEKARDSTVRQLGFRLQWLLHTVASDAALLVTLAYFSLLYDSSQGIQALDLLQHGINSVFMLFECFFGGVPVRLANVVYAMCYAMLYILFSLFYWVSDRTNVIYPVLDWNNPGLTVGILCGLMLGGIPLVHTVWWALHLLRCFIGGALLRRDAKCGPSSVEMA